MSGRLFDWVASGDISCEAHRNPQHTRIHVVGSEPRWAVDTCSPHMPIARRQSPPTVSHSVRQSIGRDNTSGSTSSLVLVHGCGMLGLLISHRTLVFPCTRFLAHLLLPPRRGSHLSITLRDVTLPGLG